MYKTGTNKTHSSVLPGHILGDEREDQVIKYWGDNDGYILASWYWYFSVYASFGSVGRVYVEWDGSDNRNIGLAHNLQVNLLTSDSSMIAIHYKFYNSYWMPDIEWKIYSGPDSWSTLTLPGGEYEYLQYEPFVFLLASMTGTADFTHVTAITVQVDVENDTSIEFYDSVYFAPFATVDQDCDLLNDGGDGTNDIDDTVSFCYKFWFEPSFYSCPLMFTKFTEQQRWISMLSADL